MRRVIRDRDGIARSADMRMQPCGHRFHRFSTLRATCLDCLDAAENVGQQTDEDDLEQQIGTQEMYRRQEGMDPR